MTRKPALLFVLAMGLAACGGAQSTSPSDVAANEPPIAKVWRSRCGACHVRVEPGTRTREHLEDALSRHRKRVRLREDQWGDLVTFLATPPPAR